LLAQLGSVGVVAACPVLDEQQKKYTLCEYFAF